MKNKNILHTIIIAFILTSCNDKAEVDVKQDDINIDSITQHIDIIEHKQLVDSKVKYLGDGMTENFEEYEKASEKPFTSKETLDTLLLIETYFTKSGCTGYEGNIDVHSDTLILKLESNTNISCTELLYYKVTYKISNPTRKKYVIVKE